jgi:FlaA1/EpsC-like NDP-sugar epimerase
VILVTGAAGSVGVELCKRLRDLGHERVIETDIETMDVTNEQQVRLILERKRPRVIYHLAGAKHAPDGELDPWHVCNVNAVGTRNVLEHRGEAKVVLASTCKACDPETAYGASKLIAERMVLNAGGTVVRFFNIPEAEGNVFRLWESLPFDEPLPVTDCRRYFVPMDEAVDLLVLALELVPGRYAPQPGASWHMEQKARELYPNRQHISIPRRRGDRREEPLAAVCETASYATKFIRITSPHDPNPEDISHAAVESATAA